MSSPKAPFTFVSGNQHKVDYLVKWLGMQVDHHSVDLDEIQSLSLRTVVDHKVRQAYNILRRPVLVEDVGFSMEAMGRLPGPFIKWFLEDMGVDGLCRMADGLEARAARVSIVYGLYGGQQVHFFEHHVDGAVANEPRGEFGFGWNPIFVPNGSAKTYAEMTDEEVRPFSVRAQAIEKLKAFLESTEGVA